MDNVVGNAIKYSPPRGEIEISIHAEADQMILKFPITDQDPGLRSARILINLQGSNIDAEVEGSGLGLAIVRPSLKVIRAHLG